MGKYLNNGMYWVILLIRYEIGKDQEGLVILILFRPDCFSAKSIVFRLNLAPTIIAARQLVAHGHIVVNKQQVTIASFQCRPGDVIEVREKESSKQIVEKSLSQKKKKYLPSHLSVNYNNSNFTGYVNKRVLRKDINLPINELLIVEYYARR